MFEVSRSIPRRGLSARERVIVHPGICLLRNTINRIPNEARTLKGLQKEAAMREGCNYTRPKRLFIRTESGLMFVLWLIFYINHTAK